MAARKNAESNAVEANANAKVDANGVKQEATGKIEELKDNAITNTYSQEKIEDIVKSFKNIKDDQIVGEMTKSVLLFKKDAYSTEFWTPLLFAIHNKLIRPARYFIEYKMVNRRLATKNREVKADRTEFELEILPLLLAINNEDDAMFDYLWSMNELWSYEHLRLVLQTLFSRTTWAKGIEIALGAEATQDIYNTLSYADKKNFLIELYYRYLHQSGDDIKKVVRKQLVLRPYSIVSLHFLMAEEDDKNIPLIRDCLKHITAEDYGKMKYEAGTEFMDAWTALLSKFGLLGDNFMKTSKAINK